MQSQSSTFFNKYILLAKYWIRQFACMYAEGSDSLRPQVEILLFGICFEFNTITNDNMSGGKLLSLKYYFNTVSLLLLSTAATLL